MVKFSKETCLSEKERDREREGKREREEERAIVLFAFCCFDSEHEKQKQTSLISQATMTGRIASIALERSYRFVETMGLAKHSSLIDIRK